MAWVTSLGLALGAAALQYFGAYWLLRHHEPLGWLGISILSIPLSAAAAALRVPFAGLCAAGVVAAYFGTAGSFEATTPPPENSWLVALPWFPFIGLWQVVLAGFAAWVATNLAIVLVKRQLLLQGGNARTGKHPEWEN